MLEFVGKNFIQRIPVAYKAAAYMEHGDGGGIRTYKIIPRAEKPAPRMVVNQYVNAPVAVYIPHRRHLCCKRGINNHAVKGCEGGFHVVYNSVEMLHHGVVD
jgi:hypothetical protein